MNLVVCKNPNDLASRAAEEFVSIAENSIREKGSFAVALSGGSTPVLLYRNLIEASLKWETVYFFFGDERNVLPDDESSNFRNANKELFRPLRIREDRIFRWRTELGDPNAIADDYFLQLVSGFSEMRSAEISERSSLEVIEPKFDLILLGMGGDGHTASLFPGSDALRETEKFAVQNWISELNAWRFTLSLPVLRLARNMVFLVAGDNKSEMLRTVLEHDSEKTLPANLVQPTDGNLIWFVDRAAASKLPQVNV